MKRLTREEYDRACARVPADETPAEFTGRFNWTIQQIKAEEAEQHGFHLEREDFVAPVCILGIAASLGLGCLASQFVGRDAFGLLAVVLLVAAAFVGLRFMSGRHK